MKYVGTKGAAAFIIPGYTVYGYSMTAIGFGQGLTAPEHGLTLELIQNSAEDV